MQRAEETKNMYSGFYIIKGSEYLASL